MRPLVCLRDRWRREQFEPTWFGLVVNPFYFARRGLLDALRPRLAGLHGRVIDVGCGRKPYARFTRAEEYVGIDVESPATRMLACADVYFDGRTIPFDGGSFDGAVCSQVLEHVFWPDAFLAEIHRVLRPGGRLVLAVPFAWDEHEQPWDYARYSSFGIRAALERAGFCVVDLHKSVTGLAAVVQLAAGLFYKATASRGRLARLAMQLLIIAPLNCLGALAARLWHGGGDIYLDNIVVASKPAAGPSADGAQTAPADGTRHESSHADAK